MPYIKDLLDLYEAVEKAGHPEMRFPSIWHEVKTADFEVTLSLQGEMCAIRKLDRYRTETDGSGKKTRAPGDSDTVTPVTYRSEARTANSAPRPLLDKLKYLAGDLGGYVPGDNSEYHKDYLDLLGSWLAFTSGNEKLSAILHYVTHGTPAGDLLGSGLIKDSEKKRFSDFSIRFRISGAVPEEPWEDAALMQSWDRYMEGPTKGIPSVTDQYTGKTGPPMLRHPKNIIAENANGKLISSSSKEHSFLHMTGGRFMDASDAPFMTWETSVKLHRMLRWLMANRSVRVRSKDSVTCWTCFASGEPVSEAFDYVLQATGFGPADVGNILERSTEGGDVAYPDKNVTVLALDYVSPGRVYVAYYQSMSAAGFFAGIRAWRDRYRLINGFGDTCYPSLYRFVLHSYGNYTSQGGWYIKDSVMKKHMNRLISAMLEGREVPDDIAAGAVRNVSRTAHCGRDVHGKAVMTAFALVAGKEKHMGDHGPCPAFVQDRSYLYGRLLAVYEWVENAAYYKKQMQTGKNTDRATNAQKYWRSFVNDPVRFSAVLHEKVVRGYMHRLSRNSQNYYQSLLDEIYAALGNAADGNGPRQRPGALNEEYILGYTHQRQQLRKRSKEASENSNVKKEEN